MKNLFVLLILASFFFGSLNSSAAGQPIFFVREESVMKSTKNKVPGFALKDQFENSYNIKFPRDKITVLIFGDREGSDQVEGWTRPIYNQFRDKIEVYGIAELSAVPNLARGVVRRIIKSKTKYSVLLDWSGTVSKSYGYEKGKANVFVIGKNGNLIAKRTGAANNAQLQSIYRVINRGL